MKPIKWPACALLCLMTCLLLCGPGPVMAQAGNPAENKTAVNKPAAPAGVLPPSITRVAVFQKREGGEQVLKSPLALARDEKNGDLIVTSFETREVVILDKSGALVKRLGLDAGLTSPYGVAIDARGRIYVSEVGSGLLKILSPGGVLLEEFDLSRIMGKTITPGRITLDKQGLIYVADLNHREILIINGRGGFVRSLGEFAYLQKAAALADGRIVGLSAQGKAVTVFAGEGKLLHSFGEHGVSSDRNVSFPTGFAVDVRGRIWIADAFQHRLKIFSLTGEFLFNYGQMEEKSGGFFFPVDLCFAEGGKLFVLEKGADRIQVFEVGDLKE